MVLGTIYSGSTKKLYSKDPTKLLKNQVKNITSSSLLLKPFKCIFYTHPINAKIGLKGISTDQSVIKKSGDMTIFCEVTHRAKIKSAIGCLAPFSDISRISMSAGSLVFYSLHTTLLMFTEEMLTTHIHYEGIVSTYLNVLFDVGYGCWFPWLNKKHDLSGKDCTPSRVTIIYKFYLRAMRLVSKHWHKSPWKSAM